jgi:phage FluMu gp28-like protein
VRLIGNVHGRKNWFYKMCRRAEAGDKNMGYHKITWRHAVNAGVLQLAEIEDARAQLPPSVFRELYEADAADDEGNPFGIEAIRKCRIGAFSKDPIACWGWDLGKRHDWTVGVALDRKARMVKLVRFQVPWAETKRRIISETNGKRALVDATGVGDPIAEDLAHSGPFTPFIFTSRSKQDLMELLQSEIQQQRLGLTGDVLLNELESFEYEYRGRDGRFTGVYYSAPPGQYDDCVCALALATRHLGVRSGEFRHARVPNVVSAGLDQEDGEFRREAEGAFQGGNGGWETRGGLI